MSPGEAGIDATFGDLLGNIAPESTNVLSIALVGTVDDCLDRWRRTVGPELPANVGVVSNGEMTRSAASTDYGTVRVGPSTVHVTGVSSPSDLTDIGIAFDRYLSAWNGDGNQVVVWIDSLTTMLQYVEVNRVFRFLNVLLSRCNRQDDVLHALIDPDAHDDHTISTLGCLFDEVVEARQEIAP